MKRKAEALLRLIVGQNSTNLRALAYAISYTAELLFVQHMCVDELCVTKHVYPIVAKQLGKTPTAVAKSVERGANLCWRHMTNEQKLIYIGRELDSVASGKVLIIYLAYYIHYGKPYFDVMATMI